ncbi:glucuronate isomerase [Fundicoccus culcitae]|uniref:Uronate isomerase n=1 Tax=Fundicoccus culcitae TaxID=2969821 RepID=A0ABY5P535_9LACT|nr:glucuronate isomerase [Fundicoccus culcitae]UUX33807.1 glucuronate isomerase [Fundicoccus culcitae]
MKFIDENFMLTNEPAKRLYPYAAKMPIFDYHCHLDPKEIYENKPYENIVSIWLAGDHYKWRLMRINGVPERLITGDGANKEKFEAWAKTLSKAFGNALYHWSHLEMQQVFGIDEALTMDNWDVLYDEMNRQITERQLSPRDLIEASHVKFIGTTDHPLDDLEWHQKIAADVAINFTVAPSFRPDEAFVTHAHFSNFVTRLAEKTTKEITDFASFIKAMGERVSYFADNGCRASDHSVSEIVCVTADEAELNDIFTKAMQGEALNQHEEDAWQTEVLTALAGLYKKHGLVAQIHFGARRNTNSKMFKRIGTDSGFDSIGDQTNLAKHLNLFLNHLTLQDKLPKMIFYNLNPAYNRLVANAIQNFQANEEGLVNKLHFGAAWWFGDTESGMLDQMQMLSEEGLLANFLGMLTDSRSFLSYQRHDYFRRILANMIGQWVVDGKVPNDEALLGKLMEDIAFNNANIYFGG